MIRPLIVAASVLVSTLSHAQGLPANCFPAGQVLALESVPTNPQRLTGDTYKAVRDALNAMPPATDYDGPLWLKRMGDEVLIGVLVPETDSVVCFGRLSGDQAQAIIALIRET